MKRYWLYTKSFAKELKWPVKQRRRLLQVKRAMRINYFDDEELIRAQAQKYSGIHE